MPNIQTFGYTEDEALVTAKEALEGCLEVDISHGNEIPPPAYKKGFPVSVASHIALRDKRYISMSFDLTNPTNSVVYRRKIAVLPHYQLDLLGSGGFEPSKAEPTDLQLRYSLPIEPQ
jgi:hypothetical protein